jgi:methyl-accepting chemotaxis protein
VSSDQQLAVAENGRQVVHPAVAVRTAEKVNDPDQIVESLAETARKLDAVISLTQRAAARTNMLALDATLKEAHQRTRQGVRRRL